jgi:hypothetical protein
MATEQYRSAELIFGWSFYRQGSSGQTSSADEFVDAALIWFGDPDPRLGVRAMSSVAIERWGSPVETAVEGQSLTEEDQLLILMEAGSYLTTIRGLGNTEARICHERAEPLCHWHFGEMASSRATMAQAISLAKELNHRDSLALALNYAAFPVTQLKAFHGPRTEYETIGRAD